MSAFGDNRVIFCRFVDDSKPAKRFDGVIIAKNQAHLEATLDDELLAAWSLKPYRVEEVKP